MLEVEDRYEIFFFRYVLSDIQNSKGFLLIQDLEELLTRRESSVQWMYRLTVLT